MSTVQYCGVAGFLMLCLWLLQASGQLWRDDDDVGGDDDDDDDWQEWEATTIQPTAS